MSSRPEARIVRADDHLPTAEAVALAKGLAARACAAKAAESAWPSVTPALQWIDRIPLVALAVLIGFCPQVLDERLVRCLGLDLSTLAALTSWQRRPFYPTEMIAALIQDVGDPGGGR